VIGIQDLTPAQGLLGKAIIYTLGQHDRLERHVEHAASDNNLAHAASGMSDAADGQGGERAYPSVKPTITWFAMGSETPCRRPWRKGSACSCRGSRACGTTGATVGRCATATCPGEPSAAASDGRRPVRQPCVDDRRLRDTECPPLSIFSSAANSSRTPWLASATSAGARCLPAS